MKFAYIQNNKVSLIVETNVIDDLLPLDTKYQNLIDISEFSPEPLVGWFFENNKFRNPADNSSSNSIPNMKITKLALLQRFTVSERLGILSYIQQNPISLPAVLLQNIELTTYVDLNRPDTQAGIACFIQLNLITQSRVNEILTTIPSDIEIYKG